MYKYLSILIKKSVVLYRIYTWLIYFYNLLRYSPLRGFTIDNRYTVVRVNKFKNTFCGYYDVSPFAPDNNNLLLVHANNTNPNRSCSIDICKIGIYNIENKTFSEIDETVSWNWQQGARLQWINRNEIIYNIYDKNKKILQSKSYHIENKTFKLLPLPVQSCFNDQYFLSLNYKDLSEYSEYGYSKLDIKPQFDGIVQYNFETGEQVILLSKNDLKNFFPSEIFERDHINHILISPQGDKFLFTYRFYTDNRRCDNLFLFDFSYKKVSLLVEKQIVSHCCWRNNSEILLWAEIDNRKGYYSISLENLLVDLIVLGSKDGHPSFLDENIFITDTYPDKNWMQELYMIDVVSKNKTKITSIAHPVVSNRSQSRCDLHPSLSLNKEFFQVDTRHLNCRSVVIGRVDTMIS